jgi:two-component system, OmpR family, response regulator VicR
MGYHIVFLNEKDKVFSLQQKLDEEEIQIIDVHNEAQLLKHAGVSNIDAVIVMIHSMNDSQRYKMEDWVTKYRCPFIVLTSETNLDYHRDLLTSWADDVITIDPKLTLLKAKCKALVRRKKLAQTKLSKLKINTNLMIDFLVHDIVKEGKRLMMPKKEYQIIKLLAENPDKVFSKDEIYLAVWGSHDYDDANLLNVHIRRIRNRIEANSNQPQVLVTRWGIGYQLIIS